MGVVGAYLQERRNAAGLTQEEVARRLGVVAKTVSDWEAGRYSPGFDLMARLLQLIGGSIEEATRLLLGGDSTAPTKESVLALANTDPKRIALLKRIMALSDDPKLRQRIEDYLDGLESGRQ